MHVLAIMIPKDVCPLCSGATKKITRKIPLGEGHPPIESKYEWHIANAKLRERGVTRECVNCGAQIDEKGEIKSIEYNAMDKS